MRILNTLWDQCAMEFNASHPFLFPWEIFSFNRKKDSYLYCA